MNPINRKINFRRVKESPYARIINGCIVATGLLFMFVFVAFVSTDFRDRIIDFIALLINAFILSNLFLFNIIVILILLAMIFLVLYVYSKI